MEMTKKVCSFIKYEIEGAENYAKMAVRLKESDKTAADTFYTMANQELAHIDMLHNMCQKHIEMVKNKGEATEAMTTIWDYELDNRLKWIANIKNLLAMYKS